MRKDLLLLAFGIAVWACSGCGVAESDSKTNGQDTHPVWSPDGTKIAFMSNRDGTAKNNALNFEIYVMDPDGSEQVRLTENADFDADITWSPDGRGIAFKSYRDKNDEIYLMNADGSNQINLTRDPAADHAPSWAPDGTKLLFNSDRSGTSQIYIMNTEGTDITQLTDHDSSDYSPAWSPGGERIAFVSERDGNAEIYVMKADGSLPQRLTYEPKSDWSPVWSPDGSQIALTYGDWESDIWSVYVMNSDGTDRRLLVKKSDSGNVSWSPDGRRIAFGCEHDGNGDIYVIHLNDLNQTRLTRK